MTDKSQEHGASKGLRTREKLELATSTVIFISCTMKLRMMLAAHDDRYDSVERRNRSGEEKRGRWGGWGGLCQETVWNGGQVGMMFQIYRGRGWGGIQEFVDYAETHQHS
jgi:hypothetical protein